MTRALGGIFVGGAATRMGGQPKGLLPVPGDGRTTLVERWRSTLDGLCAEIVLVGRHAAYAELAMELLADDPPGIGPLGGLVALLRRAGDGYAVAVACDMPFVPRALVERLLEFPAGAPIVAPRRDGKWEPICARYDALRVLPLALEHARAPRHSLQRLLDAAGAVELPLGTHEAEDLRDWDRPEDTVATPQASTLRTLPARGRARVSGR